MNDTPHQGSHESGISSPIDELKRDPSRIWTDIELDWETLVFPFKFSEAEAFIILEHFDVILGGYEENEHSPTRDAIERVRYRLAQLIDPGRAPITHPTPLEQAKLLERLSAQTSISGPDTHPKQEQEASSPSTGQETTGDQAPT